MGEIAAAVEAIGTLRVATILAPNSPAGPSKLLAVAVADETVQAAIVSAYTAFDRDPDTFWSTTLGQVKGLGSAEARAKVELVADTAA